MKKKLAILLTVIMLVGYVFSVVPSADTTGGAATISDTYEPVIAYSNLNYVEDLILMFAVPAPNELPDGSSVKVVVWEATSAAYSYKDSLTTETSLASAVALEAEESKVTIGGAEHLVFKYKFSDPKKMTDIIYARPVVVNGENKATAYGDVLDYSVVEYIQTAKGAFNDGTPVVSNANVLELLDSILDFGALMQTFRGEDEIHAPNGYLANDNLHKIWITPVVGGKTLDKVFGGFFKYEEDGYATLHAPFYDGYNAIVYKDSLGNELTDANPSDYDDALGFQLDAVDADIDVTIKYEFATVRDLNASEFGEGFSVNNADSGFKGDPEKITALGCNYGTVGSVDLKRGVRVNFSSEAGTSSSIYAGFKTVKDDAGNLSLLVTATNMPTISFHNPLTIADYNKYGYGDTVDEAITMEVELGRPSPDSNVTVSYFFLLNESSWAKSEGHGTTEVRTYLFGITNNNVVLEGGRKICELPETGTVKIALVIMGSGEVKSYYSNSDGDMIAGPSWTAEQTESYMGKEYKDKHAKYLANLEDDNPDNNETYLAYANISNYISMNSLGFSWTFGRKLTGTALNDFNAASVEMGDKSFPVYEDGKYNLAAAQIQAEKTCSVLLKSWKIYVGNLYK